MTEKRFTLSQNGTFHTVRDNVENKPLGVFEFKDDEFPAYACFHEIIDLLNQLNNENEQLKAKNIKLEEDLQEAMNIIDHLLEELKKVRKENRQLKQFKDKTFDLLDKEITENEEAMEVFKKKGVGIGAMGFHTNMLKILQKELQE